MNNTLLILGASTLLAFTSMADTIKEWDFNSPDIDSNANTGTTLPHVGTGTPAKTVGGVGNRFGTVASAATTDPNTFDNSMWRIGTDDPDPGFPSATVGNKTTGVEFHVNSSGYSNMVMTWDQENSASASKYWRVQYTTNGIDWVDHETVITAFPTGPVNDPTGGTPLWQTGLTADFSTTPGVNNNKHFGVRLVSEFEFTAIGSGTNAYVGNRGGYSSAGTLWLDMVRITGDQSDPGNQWPVVSSVSNVSALAGTPIPGIPFTISDAETPANDLVIEVLSSNPTLVTNLSVTGTGNDRTLNIVPEAGQIGTAAITIRVTDLGGKATESSFFLTVNQPLISKIFSFMIPWDATNNFASFTVTNLPGDPESWVVSATSSATNLIPNSGLEITGSGETRTITFTPTPNAVGTTVISVTASNQGYFATTNFTVKLLPELILSYNFMGLSGTTPPASAPVGFVTNGLTAAPLTRGIGLRAAALANGFSADTWNNPASTNNPSTPSRANAISRGDYFEFSVSVAPGATASFATIDASMRRSALNAAMNFEWQYSFDDFSTAGVNIPPVGAIWEQLGWSQTFYQYLGRTSGTRPAVVNPYDWVIKDVPGHPNTTTSPGDAIPTIDLSGLAGLQNVVGPQTITFRLYGWGNNSTADSNTSALGRVDPVRLRGTVVAAPVGATLQVSLSNGDVLISWPDSISGTLESTVTLGGTWTPVEQAPVQADGRYTVTVPATGSAQFFQLHQ